VHIGLSGRAPSRLNALKTSWRKYGLLSVRYNPQEARSKEQSGRSPVVSSPPFSRACPGLRSGKGQGGIEKPAGLEEIIIFRIVDKVPKHIDEIAQEANMPVRHAAATLLELELRGLVSQLSGKYFIS